MTTQLIIDIDPDCTRRKSETSCRHYVRMIARHRSGDNIVERLMSSTEIKSLLTHANALDDYPRFLSDHAVESTKREKILATASKI